MRPLLIQILPFLKHGALVTDVGSVKGSIVRDLEGLVSQGGANFIGSHPMAGSEQTGVSAARADLFVDAICVVTPTSHSKRAAVGKVEALWKSVGGRVLRLTPQAHDDLVSRSSHLPHVLAATLTNCVLDSHRPKQQPSLCANGFRDTTRIASGSPQMWRDIALANRRNLARAINEFQKNLTAFKRALESKNEKAISQAFQRAKTQRDHWLTRARSNSSE
jgi:prephenate dehydrogenase